MNVLERIVAAKRAESAKLRSRATGLRSEAEARPPARPFGEALAGAWTGSGPRRETPPAPGTEAPPAEGSAAMVRAGVGGRLPDPAVALIAEVKRRSPSAGWIREDAEAAAVAAAYEAGGAAAVSVLTDGPYFGGSLADLSAAREAVKIPVLRKDFVLDPVQLFEARAAGADAVLLIARILEDAELADLSALAGELGMSALVEVHDARELDRALRAGAAIVGVNNRDLDTFRTDLNVVLAMADAVPPGVVLVAESGIETAADVDRLGAVGVDAVLVGEALMRAPDPGAAAARLAGRPRAHRGGTHGDAGVRPATRRGSVPT